MISEGKILEDKIQRSRIDDEDILEAAREKGLENIKQVKYAVLEKSGHITIIPKDKK